MTALKSFFFLLLFICVGSVYSQTWVVDTLADRYYLRYQVDENTQIKNGHYEMIYKDKIITRGNYKNNRRAGTWEFLGMNDTLQQIGGYVDGYKDGAWESYYSDGKLSCKFSYKSGKKEGVFKGFYRNGNPIFEMTYINDSAEGLSTNYFENGKISETETYKGDTLNGLSKRYYENGTLKEEKYMIGSKRDGIYLFYYEDGALWEHIEYRNGNPYNVIASNAADGKPIDCCTLKNGSGIMRFYDKNGRATQEVTYSNSQKNGLAKYYEKGLVSQEGNYLNDKYSGMWIDNFSSGELYSKINYVADDKQGNAEYYFKNGKISEKGQFEKGRRAGLWLRYDEKGNLESELNYSEGKLNGEAKYYEKGKLVCTGKLNKGTRIFVWTFYNAKGKVNYSYDYGYTFVSKTPTRKAFDNASGFHKEAPLTIVEIMPSFPGGEGMMMEFIQKNIHYPQAAKEAGISGTVYINFTIDNTGEIIDAIVLKGVLNALDLEALRVVELMPRWKSGMQNGRPVSVSYNLPIKYILR
ncbi:MAG TPA: TonB family protein [Bacteroidia bacterium]|jgi:TonB family protein